MNLIRLEHKIKQLTEENAKLTKEISDLRKSRNSIAINGGNAVKELEGKLEAAQQIIKTEISYIRKEAEARIERLGRL